MTILQTCGFIDHACLTVRSHLVHISSILLYQVKRAQNKSQASPENCCCARPRLSRPCTTIAFTSQIGHEPDQEPRLPARPFIIAGFTM